MALPEGLKDFSLAGKAALMIGAEHPVGRVAAVTLVEAGAQVAAGLAGAGHREALKEIVKAVAAAGGKTPRYQVQSAAVRADVRAADRPASRNWAASISSSPRSTSLSTHRPRRPTIPTLTA